MLISIRWVTVALQQVCHVALHQRALLYKETTLIRALLSVDVLYVYYITNNSIVAFPASAAHISLNSCLWSNEFEYMFNIDGKPTIDGWQIRFTELHAQFCCIIVSESSAFASSIVQYRHLQFIGNTALGSFFDSVKIFNIHDYMRLFDWCNIVMQHYLHLADALLLFGWCNIVMKHYLHLADTLLLFGWCDMVMEHCLHLAAWCITIIWLMHYRNAALPAFGWFITIIWLMQYSNAALPAFGWCINIIWLMQYGNAALPAFGWYITIIWLMQYGNAALPPFGDAYLIICWCTYN